MLRLYTTIFVFCFSLSLAFAPPAVAAEGDKFISVEGTGIVPAPPDAAVVSTGVVTRAASARKAVERANAAMPNLFKLLQDMGVQQSDVVTRGFAVTPQFARREAGKGPPRIVGYRVSKRVRVTVRDLTRLGAMLDRLAAARNTIVGRVRYRVGELEPLIDEARQKAVKDARRRAALYAKSVGVRLGKVQRIVERGLRLPQPPRQASAGGRRGAGSVIPGRQEVRAIIGVTFAIR